MVGGAALQHDQLVAQNEDLDLFGPVWTSLQHHPAHERHEDPIDQRQRHRWIMLGRRQGRTGRPSAVPSVSGTHKISFNTTGRSCRCTPDHEAPGQQPARSIGHPQGGGWGQQDHGSDQVRPSQPRGLRRGLVGAFPKSRPLSRRWLPGAREGCALTERQGNPSRAASKSFPARRWLSDLYKATLRTSSVVGPNEARALAPPPLEQGATVTQLMSGVAAPAGPDAIGQRRIGVLVVVAPPAIRDRQLPLHAPAQMLGRHCHALTWPTVSRHHARVWLAEDRICIEDLASANGTMVNDTRIAGPRVLRNGDRLRFGEVEAVFYAGSARQAPIPRSEGPRIADPALSDTTRYLCAATHIDRHYREHVLDLTIRETHRAVCPSYGVDLSVVARHAAVAHRRACLRDSALATILLAAALLLPLASFAEAERTMVGPAFLGTAAVLMVLAVIVTATDVWIRLSTLSRYLTPGRRPDLDQSQVSVRTSRQLQSLGESGGGNVIVHSVYEPFVGSGIHVDSRSYTLPLLPQDESGDLPTRQPVEFGARELVDEIADALHGLRLDGVQVDRKLFVNGFDVARFAVLLPSPRHRPVPFAPTWLLDQMTEYPTGHARPYLCIRFTGWRGQLVVTTYIRVVVLNGLLYIEEASYFLPPLRAEYLAVDAMHIRTLRERVVAAIGQIAQYTLPSLLGSPGRLFEIARARRRIALQNRSFDRKVHDRVWVDRGTSSSIREQAARTECDRYFMDLDIDMAISVVRQRIPDKIKSFLEARGYQTDKITNIQNNYDQSINLNNVHGNVAGIGHNAHGNHAGGSQPHKPKGRKS